MEALVLAGMSQLAARLLTGTPAHRRARQCEPLMPMHEPASAYTIASPPPARRLLTSISHHLSLPPHLRPHVGQTAGHRGNRRGSARVCHQQTPCERNHKEIMSVQLDFFPLSALAFAGTGNERSDGQV